MLDMKELFWAAGFMEGEGSFIQSRTHYGIRCSAGQVNKEPLERLQKIFGGSICLEHRAYKNIGCDIWIWRLGGGPSAAVMMTLYSLMSEKRRGQIKVCLDYWKNQCRARNPMYRYSYYCKRGHELTHGSPNVRVDKKGHRNCWICIRANWRAKELRRQSARRLARTMRIEAPALLQ